MTFEFNPGYWKEAIGIDRQHAANIAVAERHLLQGREARRSGPPVHEIVIASLGDREILE
ncbi:hypothetical protein [Sphingomonas koreensis]|uniref:hypothetical protein n=1 Tax=Sphingomonas koreensis TaxID=93064 RepID=UPI000F745D9A|nr:hypothetical protein [Sphingomonas koreensis]